MPFRILDMLDIIVTYVFNSIFQEAQSSVFETFVVESTSDLGVYGKEFVVKLMQPEETYNSLTQEIDLYIILKDRGTSATMITNLSDQDFTVTRHCWKQTFASNASLLIASSTIDVALYVQVRTSVQSFNTMYAFLSIPVHALGQEYRTVSQDLDADVAMYQRCYVTSVQNDTDVWITGHPVVHLLQFESKKITYGNLTNFSDVLIKSSKPVSVVCGGSTPLGKIGNYVFQSLYESQVTPTKSWGKSFQVKIPYLQAIFKIVFSELYTVVNISELVDQSDEMFSFYVENANKRSTILPTSKFPLSENKKITIKSSKPILVAIFFMGNGTEDTHMAIVGPTEQSLNSFIRYFGPSCVLDDDSDSYVDPLVKLDDGVYAAVTTKMATIQEVRLFHSR